MRGRLLQFGFEENRGNKIEEGFDGRFKEVEEVRVRAGIRIGIGIGIGGNDTVDLEKKRIAMRNEGVEALRDGSATDQGFDIADRVEDQKNERIGKRIEAVVVVDTI